MVVPTSTVSTPPHPTPPYSSSLLSLGSTHICTHKLSLALPRMQDTVRGRDRRKGGEPKGKKEGRKKGRV